MILHKKIEKVVLPKKIEEALKQIFKNGFEKKEYIIDYPCDDKKLEFELTKNKYEDDDKEYELEKKEYKD